MTFRKITALLLPALLLGLAWVLWGLGGTPPKGVPEREPSVGESNVGKATPWDPIGQEARDGLLSAPIFLGQILDDRGLPHPGVEVQLCGTELPPEILITAKSDDKGRVRLEPDRAACSHRYVLRARAQDGFPWVLGDVSDPEDRQTVEFEALRVPRPAKILGRVMDPENRAVAGVKILFIGQARRSILGDEAGGLQAESGADGRFTLVLPPHVPHRIQILDSDRFQAPPVEPQEFDPGPSPFVLRVQILPESDLEIRFWTWTRRPHPGVRHTTHPDTESGFLRLEARVDQMMPSVLLEQRIRIPKSGRVDVFMPRGARVALQPRPLPPKTSKVWVRFLYLGPARTVSSSGSSSGRIPAHPLASKHEGRFEAELVQGQVLLQELLPGRWRFSLEAKGWPESQSVEVVLAEAGLRLVRIVPLVGPSELSGLLTDRNHRPVPARLLRLYAGRVVKGQVRAPNRGWLAQIRTDAHGEFRFLGLPLGEYQLWSRAKDGQEALLTQGRLHSGKNPRLQLLLDD